MQADFIIAELDRRIGNMIQFGSICAVDNIKARLKVKIGDIVTNWLPWLTKRAGNDRVWWLPEIGEQVLVLAPSGELNQAVILPSLYQQKYPAPDNDPNTHKTLYQDGTVVEYNKSSHALNIQLNPQGSVTIQVGKSCIYLDGSGIKLSGVRIDLN